MLVKDFNRKKRKGGKLDHKWKGPYVITKSLGRGLYSLQATDNSLNDISRINGAHLKQYLSPLHSVSFISIITKSLISFIIAQEAADTTSQDDNTSFQDHDSYQTFKFLSISQCTHNGSENLTQEVRKILCYINCRDEFIYKGYSLFRNLLMLQLRMRITSCFRIMILVRAPNLFQPVNVQAMMGTYYKR